MTIHDADGLTTVEARLTVLEVTVAAMVAQLPSSSRDEVVGMLAFVADATGDARTLADRSSLGQLDEIAHWAGKMLERAMDSRKSSRPEKLTAEQAATFRYGTTPSL